MRLNAERLSHQELNRAIRESDENDVRIINCCGQRYLGAGLSSKQVEVTGTPGNALGAYLDGASITVYGDAQDAMGDTMNGGTIVVHGMAGDAAGYAMRGGEIYIHKNAGYRCGVHMKAYKDRQPVLVIGGEAGSFLGEYQAGGIIVVLGLGTKEKAPVNNFCGMGMYGGRIFLRGERVPQDLSSHLSVHTASQEELKEIAPALERFGTFFKEDMDSIMEGPFQVIEPNVENPYRQRYAAY